MSRHMKLKIPLALSRLLFFYHSPLGWGGCVRGGGGGIRGSRTKPPLSEVVRLNKSAYTNIRVYLSHLYLTQTTYIFLISKLKLVNSTLRTVLVKRVLFSHAFFTELYKKMLYACIYKPYLRLLHTGAINQEGLAGFTNENRRSCELISQGGIKIWGPLF